jgi:hypothetical protein
MHVLLCCFLPHAGAIYAADSSSVNVVNSSLVGNYVQDYNQNSSGGAAYVYDNATLTFNNTLIKGNQADTAQGGGVAMGSGRWAGCLLCQVLGQHCCMQHTLLALREFSAPAFEWCY